MDQQKLRLLESYCIQEEAPACIAACPMHMDVRLMLRQLRDHDMDGAFKTYRKSIPFPSILSRICEEPCQKKCRLSEIGEGISIRALESFLFSRSNSSALPTMLPQKNKKVAFLGSGLDALAAAYDLRRKGYITKIYEPASSAGGFMRNISETILPSQIIDDTCSLLIKMGIELNLSQHTTGSSVLQIIDSGKFKIQDDEFICVYISGNLEINRIDQITRMTETSGIFGGTATPESWIEQAADGRRAAISIDRYIQNVSMTASRSDEGSYETRLFTSLTSVPPSHTFIRNSQTIPDEDTAMQEAARCIQCTCMECAKGCEFIRHYESYPRVYLRQVYNNVSICTGLRQKNNMINSCSVCGQCESVCPNKLNFHDVIRETRQTMVETKKMPPSAFDFALRDMIFSNSDAFTVAKSPEGYKVCSFVFFPGCQLSASNPAAVEKVYALLLEKFSDSTGLLLRCCGIIADWAGEKEKFQQARNELLQEVESLGNPELIVGCPGCMQTFRNFYPALKIRSLWTILDQMDIHSKQHETIQTFAIHDPCGARYQPEVQDAVRSLAKKIGIQLEELPLNRDQTSCCTYGGNAWNANRSLSDAAVDALAAENPHDYLTYCAMCRDFFLKRGKNAYHILDLFFNPERIISGKAMPRPDYSMRHENRSRLKKHLLKKYWSEEMNASAPYEKIKLFISEEVRSVLEERMILVEDLQQVLYQTLETGNRMVNAQTGHYLTHATPGHVTYWIEYLPKDDGYQIFTAYSHRMFIEEAY